jgi:hypothetical protein
MGSSPYCEKYIVGTYNDIGFSCDPSVLATPEAPASVMPLALAL